MSITLFLIAALLWNLLDVGLQIAVGDVSVLRALAAVLVILATGAMLAGLLARQRGTLIFLTVIYVALNLVFLITNGWPGVIVVAFAVISAVLTGMAGRLARRK